MIVADEDGVDLVPRLLAGQDTGPDVLGHGVIPIESVVIQGVEQHPRITAGNQDAGIGHVPCVGLFRIMGVHGSQEERSQARRHCSIHMSPPVV